MTTAERPYWTVWVGPDERPVTAGGSTRFADAVRFDTFEQAQQRAHDLEIFADGIGEYEVRSHSEAIRLARRNPKGKS